MNVVDVRIEWLYWLYCIDHNYVCRVIVLSDGQIQEFQSPNVLLENKQSLFYAMAKDAGLV